MANGHTPRRTSVARAIAADGRPDVRRLGVEGGLFRDLYHRLTRMSWRRFCVSFVLVFLALNAFFAGLYALDPAGLSAPAGDPTPIALRDFFFSVHTIATVGYGNVYPVDIYANVVVVVEITIGVLFFALTSGLAFARFSIPRARILFSDKAIVTMFEGAPTLMLRAANQRENVILEASVTVSLLRTEEHNGKSMRRFYELPLVRSTSPFFALTWQVMHRIDETSPLDGFDTETFAASQDEIVVVLRGVDSSVAQTIHGRQAYSPEDVYFDHDFVDVISRDEAGAVTIDYRKFHDIHPASRPEPRNATNSGSTL